ncbi:MAG: type II toxin-antitoxin system VapC family toxin [Chloroflexota bacterium]
MSDKRVVVDASVALKWFLRDEEVVPQADALLDDLLASRLSLLVPTIFDYEIANALKVAAVRGRLPESDARTALDKFRLYLIERADFIPIQSSTFQLALKHQRSVYDSAYITLAQSLGLWFFTGDKRLFNAVGNILDWVKWIGDYQLDSIPDAEADADASENQ